MDERQQLVARWFALTRTDMPVVAKERGWPVHLDHCFQRILLDNAVQGAWRKAMPAPAWRNASAAQLTRAIELGEAALAGDADLVELNRRSLEWRGKRRGG